MKSEEVVLVAAVGAGSGAVAHQFLSTGNALYDVAIGAVLAVAGWYTEYDGVSDFVEGFGVGYIFDSVL